MSRKWASPSGKLSIVNLIFLSKEFKRSCISFISFSFSKSKVSSIYRTYAFIKDLLTKSLIIIFNNLFNEITPFKIIISARCEPEQWTASPAFSRILTLPNSQLVTASRIEVVRVHINYL